MAAGNHSRSCTEQFIKLKLSAKGQRWIEKTLKWMWGSGSDLLSSKNKHRAQTFFLDRSCERKQIVWSQRTRKFASSSVSAKPQVGVWTLKINQQPTVCLHAPAVAVVWVCGVYNVCAWALVLCGNCNSKPTRKYIKFENVQSCWTIGYVISAKTTTCLLCCQQKQGRLQLCV